MESEAKLQQRCVMFMRNELRIERGLFFSIPNDGTKYGQFAATGRVSGMPDLCWLHNRTAIFFELKTVVGRLDPKQKAVATTLTDAGFPVYLIRTFEQFQNQVHEILTNSL